jgi:hypothetical protein
MVHEHKQVGTMGWIEVHMQQSGMVDFTAGFGVIAPGVLQLGTAASVLRFLRALVLQTH